MKSASDKERQVLFLLKEKDKDFRDRLLSALKEAQFNGKAYCQGMADDVRYMFILKTDFNDPKEVVVTLIAQQNLLQGTSNA